MTKFFLSMMMFVVPLGLLAGPSSVQLQYLPNTPVLQTSSVEVELNQQKPGTSPVIAHQEVQARLKLNPDGHPKPLLQLPVNMTIDLQGMKVGSEANGKTTLFDSQNPGTSPLMSEIAKVIGHPMQITVGEDLQVTSDSKEFVKLMQDLESMGGFRTSSLISEMFEHLFALAGHDLRVGQEYTQQLALGADQNIPVTITYKVAAITDSEVRATVSGGFSSSGVENESTLLSGHIDGKAVWSRKNALIYKTRLEYVYEGFLNEGGQKVPIKVILRHEDSTKAL